MRIRLGVLGAGRLGSAIAKTWHARARQSPLIWSRSGYCAHAQGRVAEGQWVTDWTKLLKAESIVIAIPGHALLKLAGDNEQARQFTGNVFSAAASLASSSLQQLFPRATILCVAPFLIHGVKSIPMLALRPASLPLSRWLQAKAELECFGDIDVVEDEQVFSQIALLGASWPVVVVSAVQAAASAGLQRLEDQSASQVGRRIFLRAIQSLLANGAGSQELAGEVATPGGITERGLKSLGDVTTLFEHVFQQMQARAEELRA
ncbi:MAG: hypothetical protein LC794_00775 [Acidobacteria bacterium]|nr:hypothetical protein [Acidobacteriota bacterium]